MGLTAISKTIIAYRQISVKYQISMKFCTTVDYIRSITEILWTNLKVLNWWFRLDAVL